MKKKEIQKKADLLRELIATDGYEILNKYVSDEINNLTREIIQGDFDDLRSLYFFKGQLIGMGKILSFPKLIIREADRQKKQDKEGQSGGK